MYVNAECLLAALLPLLSVSCTVLEDRSPCPCSVKVCPVEGKSFRGDCLFFSFPEDGSSPDSMETLEYGLGSDQTRVVSVPKGYKTLTVLEGASGMEVGGGWVQTRPGCECDSLRCWSSRVDCRYEDAVLQVGKTKHFATVHFSFEDDGAQRCVFRVRVRGACCGLDLSTLEPVRGEYLFMPEPSSGDGYDFSFRVPRQLDDSLELEVLELSSMRLVNVIQLGGIMKDAGYDWTKAELDDVRLMMDHVATRIDVEVLEWADGEEYVEV